ncbi:MAG: type II toxin-antitoxin system VapC family toxin [Desulfuromonadales bacterium]|nr:type II toxin-antitoxin system VapC family toxin [Desulfuromonadales bacterium]
MNVLVVDASIAVKWFLPEQYSINALRLLDIGYELQAPDLIIAECGNVLWKKWLRHELEPELIPVMLSDLCRMNLRIVPAFSLIYEAARIAVTWCRSFYDSIYLALAVTVNGRMVTADEKLCNALKDTSMAERVIMIGDLA